MMSYEILRRWHSAVRKRPVKEKRSPRRRQGMYGTVCRFWGGDRAETLHCEDGAAWGGSNRDLVLGGRMQPLMKSSATKPLVVRGSLKPLTKSLSGDLRRSAKAGRKT